MAVKIALLVVFFTITIFIGVYYRKRTATVQDFVLGGRKVGAWLTAFAYGTTFFSAVVFIGYAGQFGWRYGMSAVWIGIGNAFIGSLLAWVILGRRTRIMTKHLEATTMPEFFGKRYDSKALKIAASVIAFVFLVPYTASVYNGLSRLFAYAFGVEYIYCIIVMAVLTAVYLIVGGYMATAMNDFVQGIIMLVGIVTVIGAVLSANGGFFESVVLLSQAESQTAPTAGMQGIYTSMFGPDPINLLGVVLLTSLGTWGLPQMVHKFYTIKSEKDIAIGTVISTVFAVVVAGGAYFMGSFGRLFIDKADWGQVGVKGGISYDVIVPGMLQTLPDILIGVVIVLVLSASMSTLSSLVLTSSSTLALDFIKGTFIKDMSHKAQVRLIRILIAMFILVSVVLAANPFTFIAQLMGISWGALAGAFLAPFLYGLFWKGVTKPAVWASFAFGVGLTLVNLLTNNAIANPINCGAIAMVGGLVIVPVVSLLTPKMNKERVELIFTCYKKNE